MATAITPLANITLASNQLTVSFTSISGAYRDLMFVITGPYSGSATAIGATSRINGDSGNNYNRVNMGGNGSSTFSYSATNESADSNYSLDTAQGMNVLHYMDYSATNKHKTVLTRISLPGVNVQAYATRWASTAAITSVTFYAPDYSGGTQDYFAAGMTFVLYGISA